MFSFFKSSKKAEEPAEPIPAAASKQEDEFIFVERKNDQPQPPPTQQQSIYPQFPGYGDNPAQYPPKTIVNNHPPSYIQGVPFKLSTQLSNDSNIEIEKIQTDEILSFIVNKVHSKLDYDFSLERSVIAEG